MEDRFDVEGYVIGFGNLDWRLIYEFVIWIVLVVNFFVDVGVICVGKFYMDEFVYR